MNAVCNLKVPSHHYYKECFMACCDFPWPFRKRLWNIIQSSLYVFQVPIATLLSDVPGLQHCMAQAEQLGSHSCVLNGAIGWSNDPGRIPHWAGTHSVHKSNKQQNPLVGLVRLWAWLSVIHGLSAGPCSSGPSDIPQLKLLLSSQPAWWFTCHKATLVHNTTVC